MRQNLGPILDKLGETAKRTEALEAAGWVPHYSIPFEILDCNLGNYDRILYLISDHYQCNWVEIKNKIIDNFNSYNISDQSKMILCQALSSHERSHYSSVVRTIFPEIEHMVRNPLGLEDLGSYASQRKLREAAGNLEPARKVVERYQ